MKGPKGKHAWTAKMGEKGQIVIPKEARELFGLHPGDTILLLGDEKKGIAIVNNNKFAGLMAQLLEVQGEEEEEQDDESD